MAAIRTVRAKAGGKAQAGSIQTPPNTQDLLAAVAQLQDSVNELISRFNGHTHSAGAVAAPDAATRVQGVDLADTNLFVAAQSS